ncbi:MULTISPECIES: LysR family transcriptional regulator [unclassified Rhizobium]|uniref:LysR family transcriptional regulator n=1 Tax=unclassified Rhizobium TaxID=2613769 RepID=UPI000648FDA0|nr:MULTISPECIES: LysR family transcriptional regulator [unclassified Rhizobium]MBN8954739.1 LysR family transcriptional regulator [Rhizobium tropici]OJY73414.1 MAG: LysR family transcriptional regulator [Rhizobium sp. 60-20]RKD72403.1 DNA-binding transcriptional LysR family regulator [Rhizobium sp. WW_1]
MDRIDLFRIFTRVVECSSFTRAADTLGLPRSSVSAAVIELEGRVGARLLHRSTRKVSPTQDGAAFYDRCLRVIVDVEETESLFRQSDAKPSGKLRTDVPGRIGRLIIAPALPSFLDQFPDIEVDLGVTDRAVNLVEDSVDCVLRVGPLVDSGLIARPIGKLPLINVASPGYLSKHGTPQTPADLDGHWAVNYASPSTGRTEPWEWMEDGVLRSLALRGRVTVNSAEGYIACAVAGLGLIQNPAYDLCQHLQAGELVEVMPDYRAEPLQMTLLYPHRRHLSRRVQVFADWLQVLLQETVVRQSSPFERNAVRI